LFGITSDGSLANKFRNLSKKISRFGYYSLEKIYNNLFEDKTFLEIQKSLFILVTKINYDFIN